MSTSIKITAVFLKLLHVNGKTDRQRVWAKLIISVLEAFLFFKNAKNSNLFTTKKAHIFFVLDLPYKCA
jgi:hypothetical protein